MEKLHFRARRIERIFQHIGTTLLTLSPTVASGSSTTTSSRSASTTSTTRTTHTDAEIEMAKVMLVEDIKHFRKTQHETTRELSALFGVVYGTLSLTSRDRVTSSAEYGAIRDRDDGFDLWKLVYKVHTAGGTNESLEKRKDRITKEYITCVKDPNETLAQYHSRFKDCIREMAATNQPVSDASQAILFIDS